MRAPDQPVILSAVRTPSGRFQGGLARLAAPALGALAIRAAVTRAGIQELAEIQEVIMGNVVSAGVGQNPARQAALRAGLPSSVGAFTINKVCGSGLKAVMLASQAIRAGDGGLFVAGGMECMSQAPFLVSARSNELRFGHAELTDALVRDGLWCAIENWGMGDAAEFIADEFGVTREAMDQFAYESQMKALAAMDSGGFEEEIVPVEVRGPRGEAQIVRSDETPRRDASLKALAGLKPAFKANGRVTAGNSSGLTDGAAAVVVASQAKAESMGVLPLARIVAACGAAIDPKFLFAAPSYALTELLARVSWTFGDVDLIELNEAFAAQVLANGYALKDKGWDWNKVNVQGGAIALGHPIGASGARVLTTLVHALKRRNLRRGVAALCLGGGEAVAMAVERDAAG